MAIIGWLNQYKGELAALIAAFLWAASSTVYNAVIFFCPVFIIVVNLIVLLVLAKLDCKWQFLTKSKV